jgi:hypothetical protein
VARLLIVIVLGAVLAAGAAAAMGSALTGVSNGTPKHATLYDYGTR